MGNFFSGLAKGLSAIIKGFGKITAPFIGIPVALAISAVAFTVYLMAEATNLAFAHLKRTTGIGKETVRYEPGLKALSDFFLGLSIKVWTEYGLKPYLNELGKKFEKTESFFVKRGVESESQEGGGHQNNEASRSKNLAGREFRKNTNNNKPKTCPESPRAENSGASKDNRGNDRMPT